MKKKEQRTVIVGVKIQEKISDEMMEILSCATRASALRTCAMIGFNILRNKMGNIAKSNCDEEIKEFVDVEIDPEDIDTDHEEMDND